MTRDELIKALNRGIVETGSLMCLGCGYEHSCGVHGCAIMREAIAQIKCDDHFITHLQDKLYEIRRLTE